MCDTHMPMYPGALTDLTIDQEYLIYWCKFYHDVVYSKPPKDRPDDFTVDYDVLMDDWLKRQEFKENVVKPPDSKPNMEMIEFG